MVKATKKAKKAKKSATKKPKAVVYAQLVHMLSSGAEVIKPLLQELDPNVELTVKTGKKQVTITVNLSMD